MSYSEFYTALGFTSQEVASFKNVLKVDLEDPRTLVKAYTYLSLCNAYGQDALRALEIIKLMDPCIDLLEECIHNEELISIPIVITNRKYVTLPSSIDDASILDLETLEVLAVQDFLELDVAHILVDSIDLTPILLTVVYPFISQIDQENSMSETQPQEQTPGEIA